MPIFGENPDYDKKCLNLYKTDEIKENTIKNLEKIIESDTKLVEKNKAVMDACCIDGYKWSDEMNSIIKYHTDMLTWFKENN